jgi:hypothetical protein
VSDPFADASSALGPWWPPAPDHEQVGLIREVGQGLNGRPRIGDLLGRERRNRVEVDAFAPGRRDDQEHAFHVLTVASSILPSNGRSVAAASLVRAAWTRSRFWDT